VSLHLQFRNKRNINQIDLPNKNTSLTNCRDMGHNAYFLPISHNQELLHAAIQFYKTHNVFRESMWYNNGVDVWCSFESSMRHSNKLQLLSLRWGANTMAIDIIVLRNMFMTNIFSLVSTRLTMRSRWHSYDWSSNDDGTSPWSIKLPQEPLTL